MPQLPRVTQRRTLARTRLFEIEQIDLQFANGTAVQYERLRGTSRGAVLVVPMLDDDTVLLIREYAAGTERYELGLPKGRIEDGEEVLSAANRELREEIGYAARVLQPLASLTLAPGYSNQISHVVLAHELYHSPADGDEPEPIEVVPWRLAQLTDVLHDQQISEARSIAALFLAQQWLARHKS